jgi:hypothetical protein
MSSTRWNPLSLTLRTRTVAACLAALTALIAPPTASAQLGRVAFGLKAGTLGVGAEASVGITRHVAIRAGLNRFSLERNQDIGDIDYRFTPRLQSLTALLDLHPFGGAFRLSGGIVSNRNEGGLDARLDRAGTIFIGEGEYSSNDVQGLTGRIGFKRSAPYVGLGFDNSLVGAGRVSFNMDLGVMFQGHPKASLEGQTSLTGDARARFDADVQREAGEIQREIDDLPRVIEYFPVLAVGLKVRP